MQQEGQVIRIVPTMGIAYLEEHSSGRVIGFSLSQLDGFKGESFQELGVVPGATFHFQATSDGRLLSVSKAPEVQEANAASANAS